MTTGWRKQECALSPLIRDLVTEVYNANRGDIFKRTVKYGETLRANITLHRVLLLFQNDPMFYGVAVVCQASQAVTHNADLCTAESHTDFPENTDVAPR